MRGLLEKRFRAIVRKLVEQELEEANVTGASIILSRY